jgi:nitrogen fixation protein NifU and related proteins
MMMKIDNPMVLRQIIMDHYQYPRNKRVCEHADCKTVHMATESCIDDIQVQAVVENGIIKDVCFEGIACTISTASTSILTELMKGKSLIEAKSLINLYFDMIDLKPIDTDPLQEAVAFVNVGKQANRIRCATIGWTALRQIIEESEDNHDK